MVLRDVMCNGYVAGCNTEFFGKMVTEDAEGNKVVTYQKDKVRMDLNARLTMADGDDVDYPSMIALYEKFEEAAKRDQVISISNRVLPWDTQNADSRDQFPGGKDGWDLSNGKGFEGIHYGEDLRATSNQDFIAASTVNNSLCFLGPHRVYSPWSATYQELIPGQGHFGPDALPGVRMQLVCGSCNLHSLLTPHLSLDRMPAGAVASRCRASRRARPWWASRRQRTRRWSSTAAARRRRAAEGAEGAAARPPGEDEKTHQ